MADDNRIEIIASLDIPKSISTIKEDLEKVSKGLGNDSLKIVAGLDLSKTSQAIKSQLTEISKNLNVTIPAIKFGDTGGNVLDGMATSAKQTANEINKVAGSIANLEDKYTKPFKAVFDKEGYLDAEATLAKIQKRLSEIGDVSVVGKYDVFNSPYSLSGVTATIKSATGEVQKLNFTLDNTDDKFKIISGSFSNAGVGKVQQDVAKLRKDLAAFESSHKAIESGLVEPLNQVHQALDNLEAGNGSVEAVQKALDSLKTSASDIGSTLKATGSSFNIFDNAVNKAENFANEIEKLSRGVESLSTASQKGNFQDSLKTLGDEFATFQSLGDVKNKDWAESYGRVASLIQNITNELKAAQQAESALAKETNLQDKIKYLNEDIENFRSAYSNIISSTAKMPNGETFASGWESIMSKVGDSANLTENDVKRLREEFNRFSSTVKLQDKIAKLTADMNAFAVANKHATTSMKQMSDGTTFAEKWNRLLSEMAKGANLTEDEVAHLRRELSTFGKEAQAAGLKGSTGFEKFLGSFKNFTTFLSANMAFNIFKRQMREMANAVIEVDTAMTEMRKVTEATDEEFRAFAQSAAKTGKELGASISDVINATSTFSRAGFSLEDAEALGKVATLYKNVGDGIDIDSASESIISVMKAFNIEAEESERIIDRINKVSNNFAIDSGGLGEALKRVASAMASANNSLDETIALTTVANEIVQDPVAVAQAWRTVSMRIRGAKTELETAGEDTEGMVESTAKLQGMIKSMTGVDIMLDETTFKSTYEIIKELGAVWDDLSDINQAQLLETIAGKRQANVVASALRNYEQLEKVLSTSENSLGSAMEEQQEYAKSVQYSIDSFKAAYQDLAQTIVNSDLLKGLIDGASTFLSILNQIIKTFGSFNTLIAGFSILRAVKGKGKLNPNMPIYAPLQLCA